MEVNMKKNTTLEESIAYLLSKKEPSYSDGLSEDQLREKLESEFNAMTRCEYLRFFFDDEDAYKIFRMKLALERGEKVEVAYRIEMRPKLAESSEPPIDEITL